MNDASPELDLAAELDDWPPASGSALARKIERVEQAIHAERGLMSLHQLEIVIRCGFLAPEDIPLIKFFQISPGIYISSERLRWCEVSGSLLVASDNGLMRADRLYQGLALGDDYGDDCWWRHVELADGSCRLQRLSLELSTVLACIPKGDQHRIVDIHDRWLMVDRRTGDFSVFVDDWQATRAADLALTGGGTRHFFLDRLDWDDTSKLDSGTLAED